MNRNTGHHNMYGSSSASDLSALGRVGALGNCREAGYALVAMLALMTVLAMFALAAAPNLRQQSQRELEKEAIFRGEQVADAIRSYYVYKRATIGTPGDAALPTSVDDLLEGIPIPGGTKRRQILRVSASRDPLSSSGEWGLVRPRSQKLIDFQRSVLLYAENQLPVPRNPQVVELQRLTAPQMTAAMGTEVAPAAGDDDDLSVGSSGPFVGVASRSSRASVLYYYGIEQHNDWIFTPLFR
jgi:type II secretory pathway pseudopilin PulG